MQEALQEDKAVDFASDISSKMSMCNNINFNLFVSSIGQELSLGKMSIVLFAVNILLKKPV